MKALSILQPWASLIVTGVKDVENRTWTTNHRGPMAVCAGSRRDIEAIDNARGTIGKLVIGTDYAKRYLAAELSMASEVAGQRGGLVGIVDLIDVVRDSTSPWAVDGCFHWVLANPRMVPFVAVKGRLGLFDVEVTS